VEKDEVVLRVLRGDGSGDDLGTRDDNDRPVRTVVSRRGAGRFVANVAMEA
jgi:hypothetical protein